MATAVSLHISLSRNWTGSLSDLASTRQHGWDDFVHRNDFQLNNAPKSNSEPTGLSEYDEESDSNSTTNAEIESHARHVDKLSKSLTFNQRLRLRQLLNHIQWHLFGNRVTEDRLKQLPLTLFSSVCIPSKQVKDDNPFTEFQSHPSLSRNYAFSETRLAGTVFDRKIAQSICGQEGIPTGLFQSRRRHCDSGSEVWLPLPLNSRSSDGSLNRNAGEHRPGDRSPDAFSDDGKLTDEPAPLNPPLQKRYESLENLTDVNLYNNKSDFSLAPSLNPDVLVRESTPEAPSISEPSATSSPTQKQPCEAPELCFSSLRGSPLPETDHDRSPSQSGLLSLAPPRCTISSPQLSEAEADSSDTGILSSRSSNVKLSKSVSFADELGKPLEEVLIIEPNASGFRDRDEYSDGLSFPSFKRSRWPNGAKLPSRFTRSRLKNSGLNPYLGDVASQPPSPKAKAKPEVFCSTWVLRFQQPASLYYEFRQRIQNGSVSLESISVSQTDDSSVTELPNLSGTIKVKNLSFEKQVLVRLTTDEWNSYTDHLALYNPQLSSGFVHSATRYDTFTFQIQVAPQMESSKTCNSIEFAICYTVGPEGSWGQYWDNNNGKNYVIEREVRQTNWPPLLANCSPSTVNSSPKSDSITESTYSYDSLSDMSSACTVPLRPYTSDYRPNFEGITQFTGYRAWSHFAGETTYY